MSRLTVQDKATSGDAHVEGSYDPGVILRDRLRTAREEAGLSQSELARRCGVSSTSINHIESGRTKDPSGVLLTSLCQVLKVQASWLATGRGQKRLELVQGDKRRDGPSMYSGPERRTYSNSVSGVTVPLVSWQYASGQEDGNMSQVAESWLPCPVGHSRATYALRVKGDAMTSSTGRSYPDGSLIFVDPQQTQVSTGDRVLARIDGRIEVVFKSYIEDAGERWLQSLNPNYPPIRDVPFTVIGRVIGAWVD